MGKSGMNEIEEDTAKETGMQEQGRKNKHKRNKDKGQKLSARDVTKLLKWVIILAVVVILVVVGYKLAKQLEITYNGVAEVPQKNHPTKVVYYVSYEAEVKASINMADIDVQIDDNVGEGQAKKIIVTLPQLQVKQIDVDMASLDYMFVKKSANTADVSEEAYAACIADAGSECRGNEVFLQMAKENCENTVKALLMPIIENQDESYELVIQ